MKPSVHAQREIDGVGWMRWNLNDKADLIVGLFVSHLIAGCLGAWVVTAGPTPDQINRARGNPPAQLQQAQATRLARQHRPGLKETE